MGTSRRLFYVACASTFFYELAISSPWWTGAKHGRFDMLATLTLPSVLVLACAYYALHKNKKVYALCFSLYVVFLQIATLAMLYGTVSGILR